MQSFHDALRSAGLLVPEQSATEARLDTQWRALTEAANTAFARRDNRSAARLYDEALDIAGQVFEVAREGGSPLIAPMIYTSPAPMRLRARRRVGTGWRRVSFCSVRPTSS